MIRELFIPLISYVTAFNVFRYITFRSFMAALTALIICLVLGPPLIRWLRNYRLSQQIREDGPESHKKKVGTPTMGGILILFAVLFSSLIWMNFQNQASWIALFAMVAFGVVGFFDDVLKQRQRGTRGLEAKFKLYSQFIISIAVSVFIYMQGDDTTTLLYIPFLKDVSVDLSLMYIPFATVLLVGTCNAVNITDGLDGLAIGLVFMVTISFSILAYLSGHKNFSEYLQIPFLSSSGELTVISMALAGASVGFLWFNAHPAQIMMGDTGSMALGGMTGILAILIKKEIVLIICGGVFVLETVSIIIQIISYKLFKKRVFLMSPIHHHFELKGWSETQVVQRFWILGGVCAILSLLVLKIR